MDGDTDKKGGMSQSNMTSWMRLEGVAVEKNAKLSWSENNELYGERQMGAIWTAIQRKEGEK